MERQRNQEYGGKGTRSMEAVEPGVWRQGYQEYREAK